MIRMDLAAPSDEYKRNAQSAMPIMRRSRWKQRRYMGKSKGEEVFQRFYSSLLEMDIHIHKHVKHRRWQSGHDQSKRLINWALQKKIPIY